MEYSNTLSRNLRWAETNRAVPITFGVAFLLGLGVFAYFASVVNNFPGEVSFSTWVQSWRAVHWPSPSWRRRSSMHASAGCHASARRYAASTYDGSPIAHKSRAR